MKKLLGSLLTVAVLCVLAAPAAHALDNCCWDWGRVGVPGADDVPPFDPKDNQSDTWAQCVPLQNPACFEREWRQEIWGDYECIVGSQAPDFSIPDDGHGYACVNKSTTAVVSFGTKSPGPVNTNITDPPSSYPLTGIGIEAVSSLVLPGTSTAGMLVLGLLMLIAAIWFLRRRRATLVASR